MTNDVPQAQLWTGWRRNLALAAGVAALAHGGFTIFDEQHNGGAGTCIVLAMVQLGAILTGRPSAPLITLLLAVAVAGRVGFRYVAEGGFDLPGAAVAVVVAAAGVLLMQRKGRIP